MTKSSVQPARASKHKPVEHGSSQLSLFDVKPVLWLPCFPMHDLHGATFRRSLLELRPRLVADLRHYPYFNLRGLSPDLAFKCFEYVGAEYVHLPFDIVMTNGVGRWSARQDLQYLAEILLSASRGGHQSTAVLVDNVYVYENLRVLARGLKLDDYDIEFLIRN